MIPGEIITAPGDIEINAGRQAVTITVANTGDRPIQVGSHFHFFEVNRALVFDRETARGRRLNIAAGTAVRFEPGEEKEILLVDFGGGRHEYIDLLDRPNAPPPTVATTAGPPSGGPPVDPLTAELDKGIKKTGEHSYEVQRTAVDSLLGNHGAGPQRSAEALLRT